ncbi:MAG: heparinase, partial [Xanthobacteraceae bacterium]
MPAIKADRLLIAPQDLRTADATRASEIYSGRFAFAGKVVVGDGRSVFEMEPPSDDWAAALLGFGWLCHLRAAESGITRANARALVDEWIALQGSWHPIAWRPDVVSRRVISWLSQSTLVLQDADVRFYRRFLRSLTRQVRYLRHTAGDANRGIARMQAA